MHVCTNMHTHTDMNTIYRQTHMYIHTHITKTKNLQKISVVSPCQKALPFRPRLRACLPHPLTPDCTVSWDKHGIPT